MGWRSWRARQGEVILKPGWLAKDIAKAMERCKELETPCMVVEWCLLHDRPVKECRDEKARVAELNEKTEAALKRE